MISFLCWNLNKKPIHNIVANIAIHFSVDIIILTECSIPVDRLLRDLNRNDLNIYHYSPSIGCNKVEIFTRFPRRYISPVFETHRLTVRQLTLPGIINILLAGVHFPSKKNWSDSSQSFESAELASSIRRAEEIVGHSNTILTGDFNMNPFEDGVVSARGLHGVMSRNIAEKRNRTVQNKQYPFFYNPMWNLFGDETAGPPGTYYYRSSEHKTYFWNIFDQVLIRPDLLSFFNNKDLKIIESVGDIFFLNPDGVPDANIASDHLHIYFKLSI